LTRVPNKDNLQVITERDSGSLTYGPSDADIRRDGLVVIQITLTEGRTAELKQTLFKTLLERLNSELSIRPEDLFVNLIEIKKETGRGTIRSSIGHRANPFCPPRSGLKHPSSVRPNRPPGLRLKDYGEPPIFYRVTL